MTTIVYMYKYNVVESEAVECACIVLKFCLTRCKCQKAYIIMNFPSCVGHPNWHHHCGQLSQTHITLTLLCEYMHKIRSFLSCFKIKAMSGQKIFSIDHRNFIFCNMCTYASSICNETFSQYDLILMEPFFFLSTTASPACLEPS